jgi:hypothetical protein
VGVQPGKVRAKNAAVSGGICHKAFRESACGGDIANFALEKSLLHTAVLYDIYGFILKSLKFLVYRVGGKLPAIAEERNEAFSSISLCVVVCVGFTPSSASTRWKPSAEFWV